MKTTKNNHIPTHQHRKLTYKRKAAFYKRFSALKAVSIQLEEPNWEQCYNLLLPALEGYDLTLDPIEYDRRARDRKRFSGWPGIHLQLMQELIVTTKKMNAHHLAVRHLSFLLHTLFDTLTTVQKRDFAEQLINLTAQCEEGAPVPLNLDNGFTIPPVNFTKFPLCTSFKVLDLSAHLRPIRIQADDNRQSTIQANDCTNGPFIFTPIVSSGAREAESKVSLTGGEELNFLWVEGEKGFVQITLRNILPIQLSISQISLMTGEGGIISESPPTTAIFDPESDMNTITLSTLPKSTGFIDVVGYKSHVLGIKSNCILSELPRCGKSLKNLPNHFSIEVVPPLPLLRASCSLPKETPNLRISETPIVERSLLKVLAGESKAFTITLTNESPMGSDLPIEVINVKLVSRDNNNILFNWNNANDISPHIPLHEGKSLTFQVIVDVISEFVHEMKSNQRPQTLHSTSREITGALRRTGISRRHSTSADRSKQDHSSRLKIPPAAQNAGLSSGVKLNPHNLINLQQVIGHGTSGSTPSSATNSPTSTPKKNKYTTTIANFISDIQSSNLNNALNSNGTSGSNNSTFASASTFSQNLLSKHRKSSTHKPSTNNKEEESNHVAKIVEGLPKKTFQSILEIEYSGGRGLQFGYSRRSQILITIEVIPSLLITSWDVLPTDLPTDCFLLLDAINATAHEMDVQYAHGREVLIESYEMCRLPIPISRCPSHLEEMATSTLDSQPDDASQHISVTPLSETALRERCKRHLSKEISLKWFIQSTGSSGIATVNEIKPSKLMLDALVMSSINMNVSLNGKMYSSTELFAFNTREPINVEIRLENFSGHDIEYGQLWLQCFTKKSAQNVKKLPLETDKIIIPKLCCSEKVAYDCGIHFNAAGFYKLDVQFSGREISTSPEHHKSKSSTRIWKYSPSIDLTIYCYD